MKVTVKVSYDADGPSLYFAPTGWPNPCCRLQVIVKGGRVKALQFVTNILYLAAPDIEGVIASATLAQRTAAAIKVGMDSHEAVNVAYDVFNYQTMERTP